jgi:NitT/TauT family transport system substrate-binding protein
METPRVFRTIAASLCALALAAVTPAQAQGTAPDRALLQLDGIPTGGHAAYFAVVARGCWREQGIELALTRGYGSGDAVNRVIAGAAECAGEIHLGGLHSFAAFARRAAHRRHPGNSHRLYFPGVARRAGGGRHSAPRPCGPQLGTSFA